MKITDQRKRRLKKIDAAQRDVESAILTLRKHVPSTLVWTGDSFQSLYYLVGLARRASSPRAGKKR